MVALCQCLHLCLQSGQGVIEHLATLLHAPQPLIPRATRARAAAWKGIGQGRPLERTRRLASFPELLHLQQISDVVVEQLVEQLLRVIATVDSPDSRGHSADVTRGVCLLLHQLLHVDLPSKLWICRIWGHIFVRICLSKQLIEQVFCPDNTVDGL
uniref:Uncharacterized protein n=1 Tax=Ixodes ricinus TaxID=34613 RepID=A0A6B0UW32_IXORI